MKEYFEEVRDSVNACMGHYQVWFTLRGDGKAIDEYLNDMNDYRYVDFFFAANVAHYKLMFIEIACLFDSGSDSYSVRNLKEQLRENNLVELANEFDRRLQPFSALVSNIKTVRSKMIAHKDIGVNETKLFSKHGIVPDQIKELLDEVAILMSKVESQIDGESSCSSVGPTDRWERATFNLLKVLRAGRRS